MTPPVRPLSLGAALAPVALALVARPTPSLPTGLRGLLVTRKTREKVPA